MDNTRIKLAVYVNLDNVPGTFHSADSAQHVISNMLQNAIPHYKPTVSIESYNTRKSESLTLRLVEGNRYWNPTLEYNLMFMRATLVHVNDVLRARKHLFLNEVLDAYGFERTARGAVEGWVDEQVDISFFYDDKSSDVTINIQTQGNILETAFPE